MEPRDRTMAFPTATAAGERVTAFLRAVYGWMCVGLAITAVVAYAITSSPALTGALAANHFLFLVLFVAQLGLVFYLSARVDARAGHRGAPFIGYSRTDRRDPVAHPPRLHRGVDRQHLRRLRACSARSRSTARRRRGASPASVSSCSWA